MNGRMTRRLAACALLLGLAGAAAFAVPVRIHYQGRLLDNSGYPVSSNVTFSIALFAQAAGGSALYTEAIGPIPVINGLYAFEFGADTPALHAALAEPECWLEVTVEGTPLAPRHRLVAVPYALVSGQTVQIDSNTLFAAQSIPGAALRDQSVTADKLAPGAVQEADPVWAAESNQYLPIQAAATTYVARAGDSMSGALALPAGGLSVGSSQLVVLANGHVGIGIANPTNRLAVNGAIQAREVVVTVDGWPDYVFEKGYPLLPLESVEAFIREHGHLPDVPPARAVHEQGLAVGEFQARLLRKVEELTLYLLDLRARNESLQRRVDELEGRREPLAPNPPPVEGAP